MALYKLYQHMRQGFLFDNFDEVDNKQIVNFEPRRKRKNRKRCMNHEKQQTLHMKQHSISYKAWQSQLMVVNCQNAEQEFGKSVDLLMRQVLYIAKKTQMKLACKLLVKLLTNPWAQRASLSKIKLSILERLPVHVGKLVVRLLLDKQTNT